MSKTPPRTAAASSSTASAPKSATPDKKKTTWQKPRITRHGNMRKLSQMSG